MRLFTVFFAIVAVGVVGPAVGVLLDTYVLLCYASRAPRQKLDVARRLHLRLCIGVQR